jgi:hypothetical protein
MNRGGPGGYRGGGGDRPPMLGMGGGGLGGAAGAGMASMGGVGMFSLLAALFTRGAATESLKLLLYGLVIELGRRIFSWVMARVPLRAFIHYTNYIPLLMI